MKKILQTIKENKKFLISTHVNPDPDALCSELALAEFLRILGKSVVIMNEESVLKRFDFLPGIKKMKGVKEKKRVTYDVAFVVDCGDLKRIGKVQDLLRKGKPLINMDHHITNEFFGDLNLVLSKLSSTCEVLYEFFMSAKIALTRNMAFCLYTGIMTDTGSFRYTNTSARTHCVAGALRAFDFSAADIYQNIYETRSLGDSKEFTKVLSQFQTLDKGKIICMELSKRVLAKFSEAFDLRDALFRFLRSIKGVEVVIICTEFKHNKTRVNLRSTGTVNVAKLAYQFQGGGHHNASGCVMDGNVAQAKSRMLKELKKVL